MALSRFVLPFADVGPGIRPVSGARLFFFATGTSTPKDTFNSSDGLTPNANPVIANSNGVFPDIFFSGTFKVSLKDKNDVQIWEADPVSSFISDSDSALVKNFLSLESAISDTNIQDGDTLSLKEHTIGCGGGAIWDAVLASTVTINGVDIVQSTGVATIALVFRPISIIDASQLGAKEDSGVTGNNVILRRALELAKASGIKEVRVNRISDDGWYGLEQINGTSVIIQQSNIDFIGVGTPELRPIIDTSTFMEASIFLTGNYHPDFFQAVPKESVTLVEGNATITVANSSDYALGDIVFVTSQTFALAAGFPVYTYMELAEIIELVDSTTISVDSYFEFGGAGFVAKAENNGVNGRFGIPLFIWQNAKIKGFKVKTLGHINPDSGTRKCEISDISGSARTGIFGNTFTYTNFFDWDLECSSEFSELSFGSHNCYAGRVKFYDTLEGLTSNNGLSWQESGRYNVLDGFEFILNGADTTSNPIRIQDQQNSVVKNGVLKIRSNGNVGLVLIASATADRMQPKNNGFENIVIESADGVPVVVSAEQTGATGTLETCFARNITYKGPTPSNSGLRLTGNAANPLQGFDCSINCEGSNVPIVSTDAESNTIKLVGDFQMPQVLAAKAEGNDVKLHNLGRCDLRTLNETQPIDVSTSVSVPDSVFRTFTVPAGSITNTDTLRFKVLFTTSGVAGTKNIQLGYLDSGAVFQSIPIAITGQLVGSLTAEFNLRDTGLTLAQIVGEYWTKDLANPSVFDSNRAGGAIDAAATNDIVLELRAWVATGDGINFNSIVVEVLENELG